MTLTPPPEQETAGITPSLPSNSPSLLAAIEDNEINGTGKYSNSSSCNGTRRARLPVARGWKAASGFLGERTASSERTADRNKRECSDERPREQSEIDKKERRLYS